MNNNQNKLLNISPIDGRYSNTTKILSPYFSEFGLFKYRLEIEIYYLVALLEKLKINMNKKEDVYKITSIGSLFTIEDCIRIKEIENDIKHDVKAVEYFMQEKFTKLKIPYANFIHFGLTSQDINNTAISLSMKDYLNDIFKKDIMTLLTKLADKVNDWKPIICMSRTHGQSAVPTSLGKEINVFHYRLKEQLERLNEIKVYSKFGGAVGNFNAHYCAYPDIDWNKFANNLLCAMGLKRSEYTTQIDNYDNLGMIFDNVKRICTILIDFVRDIWHYISIDYLIQNFNLNEVGSSTMPHKINPINFENAEGNLMMCVTICEFLSRKLPISRLQRDLTDSTVLRNIGVVFGHWTIAYKNICDGLLKIYPNKKVIEKDLLDNPIVLTEAYQTILRKHGYKDAYEQMKELGRNNTKLTIEQIRDYISKMSMGGKIKEEMLNVTMTNYIGNALH
jgi:adenylosuccinate lyase